jgi:molybdopterin-guanine dinucleotide biosynthesis protein A
LRRTGAGELFVSGHSDGPYSAAGLTIVADENAGSGPLGGIVAALRVARFECLVVLAIDLPKMTSEFLVSLVESAMEADRGIVPVHASGFEPMAAVYTRACLRVAEEHLAMADLSMRSFIEDASQRGLLLTQPVAREERALFVNLNTPDDLAALR